MTIKQLLKEKPNATSSELTNEEIMVVVNAICKQKQGLSATWERNVIQGFLLGWDTVKQAAGYIA